MQCVEDQWQHGVNSDIICAVWHNYLRTRTILNQYVRLIFQHFIYVKLTYKFFEHIYIPSLVFISIIYFFIANWARTLWIEFLNGSIAWWLNNWYIQQDRPRFQFLNFHHMLLTFQIRTASIRAKTTAIRVLYEIGIDRMLSMLEMKAASNIGWINQARISTMHCARSLGKLIVLRSYGRGLRVDYCIVGCRRLGIR